MTHGQVPPNFAALATDNLINNTALDDNGWGSPITFSANTTTGVVTFTTTIVDATGRAAFLATWKNFF